MRNTLFAVAALAVVGLTAGTASAAGPASYEAPWSPAANQETYWESALATPGRTVDCTKYSNHSGWIPAEYDAAVLKDGSSVVKVYPDLTGVGGFTATGAINPANGRPYDAPHSWVMKCKFRTVTTTTTTTTTTVPPTTTTVPPTTSTTVPPTTTVPSTTVPATTVPETTTTAAAPATTAPETTVPETTAPPTTVVVTTVPPSVDPTTTVAVTTPPTVAPTATTTPPAVTPPPTLPATGTDMTLPALLAGLAVATGVALLAVRRRGAPS